MTDKPSDTELEVLVPFAKTDDAIQTNNGPSRRVALQLGAGAVAGFPWIWKSSSASAGPSQVSARKFSRGINAWPWFAMPLADPVVGQPYTSWPPYNPSRPVPTTSDLAALAGAGFDFIRLNVDPAPFMNTIAIAGYSQFSQLFTLLINAIKQANAAGLGVIVNLQPGGSPKWTPETLYGTTATSANFSTYTYLVAILANQLGQLNITKLALEPVNEPPQDSTSQAGLADWNNKQVALLSAARAQAPNLTLVATGASSSSTSGLQTLDPQTLIKSFDPLLFTFHFYEPFLFSHQGAPWAGVAPQLQYRWLNNVPWPAAAGSKQSTLNSVTARMNADPYTAASVKSSNYALTQSLMTDYFNANVDWTYIKPFFDSVTTWAANHGLTADRILMGEFGALQSSTTVLDTWDAQQQSATGGPYVAANPADRLRYISDVRVTAEQHGFSWSMWTLFNPGMGLITSDTNHTLDRGVLSALGLNVPS